MLEHRGIGRGSVISGSSVHNQRTECIWRDLHECVTKLFHRLFYYLEELSLLDHNKMCTFMFYTMFLYQE